MQLNKAFQPAYGKGQTVTTGAASASVDLGTGKEKNVRIHNSGLNNAYIRIGEGAQNATAADFEIVAGEAIVLSKNPEHNTLAHLQNTAATTLYIIVGEGN